MINYSSLIATKLESLPVDKQQQVLDFVEFLAQKTTSAQNDIKRVPDLHQGKIWMSDDFNQPLDD
ncbi:MAG: hypothetical protein RLZZ381_3669 [Cyanobacteriota bacterium]|jgi:hypothetical protein